MAFFVIVCGAPNSGNKLLSSLITHVKRDNVVVHTPYDIRKVIRANSGKAIKAVVPIRTSIFWEASIAAKRAEQGVPPMNVFIEDNLRCLRENDIEPFIVTYESIVQFPEITAVNLYKYLHVDVPTPLFPETIGESTYIYDANIRHVLKQAQPSTQKA